MLAPVKINLYLDVLGRRPDGFHELETLFVRLPWGDDVALSLEEEPGIRLRLASDDPSVPADASNLAVRAADAYLSEARHAGRDVPAGLTLRLTKHIPAGAGLGGGSSDAAAVLRLLDGELGLLPPDVLRAVAARLGSDVPFFLLDEPAAVGRGRGEILEPLAAAPPEDLILILPGSHHDTGRVFGCVTVGEAAAPPDGLAKASAALARGSPSAVRGAAHNGLEPAVLRAYPRYGALVDAVAARLGRRPQLTGTGSALYDLPEAGEAEAVAARLADLPVEIRVVRRSACE